jgi:putative ABC transport system permease protein
MFFEGVLPITLEQGLGYALVALGIALTFRVLAFPDLTVDGSFPLGGAVCARLIVEGMDPYPGFGLRYDRRLRGRLPHRAHEHQIEDQQPSGRYSHDDHPLFGEPAHHGPLQYTPLNRAHHFHPHGRDGDGPGHSRSSSFSLRWWRPSNCCDYFLHTEYGMALRATGDNEQMIRSLGVDTDKATIFGLGHLQRPGGAFRRSHRPGPGLCGRGHGHRHDRGMGLAAIIIGEGLLISQERVPPHPGRGAGLGGLPAHHRAGAAHGFGPHGSQTGHRTHGGSGPRHPLA